MNDAYHNEGVIRHDLPNIFFNINVEELCYIYQECPFA